MIEHITQEDLEAFERHKQKRDAYTQSDALELDNLIRKYINRWHTTCSSCGGGLREAKDTANQWLAHNREKIVKLLAERSEPAKIETKKNPRRSR